MLGGTFIGWVLRVRLAVDRFSPAMAAGGIPRLDFIIDLTYTTRYYSPAVSV